MHALNGFLKSGCALLLSRSIFIWLCLFSFFAVQLKAASTMSDEDFLLRNWDTEDGLPSSTVNNIARDQQGYLWVATWRGLARFDGRRWTIFNDKTTPALKNLDDHKVWVDRSGRLWLAPTRGGLALFSSNVFEEILPPAATGGTFVRDLAQDGAGALWLAATNGILRLREGNLIHYSQTDGKPIKNISSILCDGAQQLWAVDAGTLLSFQNDAWHVAILPAGLKVISIASCRAGGLWVVATNGVQSQIFRWPKASPHEDIQTIHWPPNLHWNTFIALAEDRSGRIWCADQSSVMVRLPNGQWHQLLPNASLDKISLVSFYLDQDDLAWIGSQRTGLYQARPRLAQTLSLPDSAPPQAQISTVAITRDESIWAGTDLGGIFRWSHGTNTWFGRDDGLSSLTVNTLLEDQRTNLWAGTSAGLCRWDGSHFQPVQDAFPLQGVINALFEDSKGNLWVGSASGLARWNNGETEVFNLTNPPARISVTALTEDLAGNIWAGTANGRLFVKPTNAPAFQMVNIGNPPVYPINGIYAAREGSIWFITSGSGLYRWKNSTLQNWNWLYGRLPSDYMFGIMDDTDGDLWISCQRGIFGIARETLNRPVLPKLFPVSWQVGTEDGLMQKICTGLGQPAAARSRDGQLWFPDGKVLVKFDPALLTAPRIAPKPVIEQVLVDGAVLTNGMKAFHIQSGVRAISFGFTAPDPVGAERQHYQTRLDGIDDDWVDMENNRSISYTRLPPGDYTFHVALASPDGTERPSASAMDFEIVPRLYEKRFVQVAAIIFVILATAAAVWRWERARSARRLARLQFQREMERERTRIARDIHDELGSGLTEIILLSNSLQHESSPNDKDQELVGKIHDRAQMLTQDMDEVVWAVDAKNDTIEGLLNYLNDFAQQHLNLAGIACKLDFPPDTPNHPISAEVRHNLFLAAKEAINNITRHSGATAASIRATYQPPQFTLTIEDNGRGFDPANTRPHASGLSNMRQRLIEIGGECDMEPLPAGGSRIRFTILIKTISAT
jgi:signal transduction histidine kinase/ligand-binding sensor domain-containing protein